MNFRIIGGPTLPTFQNLLRLLLPSLASFPTPIPHSGSRTSPPMAAVSSASAEAVAASATRRPPLFRAASFRPAPRRLPAAAVATSASSSRGVACKAKDASALDDVPDVAQSTWDEVVLGCEAPVLVEFWAPWCGPCRLMHPIIAELARRYAGRLRCLKLNTDDNQDVATRYGIRSIPTIVIFKNGERKETVIGAVPDTTLATTVERFL